LRAGLLSDPKVISRLNRDFVSTSIIIDDLEKRAADGDDFAKKLAAEWVYPVEMMFVTPECAVVSKLNSYKDFPGMHPDVSAPPGKRHAARMQEQSHSEAFLSHLGRHFGPETKRD
jgi:hypothetical protein